MRIEIADGANLPQSSGNSRIEEIEDDLDVETCFICNNKPSKTRQNTTSEDQALLLSNSTMISGILQVGQNLVHSQGLINIFLVKNAENTSTFSGFYPPKT